MQPPRERRRPGRRIGPVTEPSPEAAELLDTLAAFSDGEPFNVFKALAHDPTGARRAVALGNRLLLEGSLDARLREIVILRVAANTASRYEWGQHDVMARSAGLDGEEVADLALPEPRGAWTDDERHLLRAVDELCDDDCVGDATWAALAERWSEPELVELLLLVGFYRMLAGFLNSAGVEADPGLPGWPEG